MADEISGDPVELEDGEFKGPADQSPTEGVTRHDEDEAFTPTTPGDPSGGGMRGPDPGVNREQLEEKGREERRIVDHDDEAFGEGSPLEEPEAAPQATTTRTRSKAADS